MDQGHAQHRHREDDDQQDGHQRNDELDVLVEADLRESEAA
jgi:hypothetical protein